MGGDWRYPPSSWDGAGRSSSHDLAWNSRPPLPPGSSHFSVPLWEKKFITIGCRIPWKRFCQSKLIIDRESNVFKWDDSAALEAFQNAKVRFEAHCFGFACDIPLPDPYMYIDEVYYDSFVDPELVADLESSSVPSFRVNAEVLVRNLNNNHSGNWDDLIEKPVQVDNTWENTAEINSSGWRVGDWSNNGWNSVEGAAAWGNGVPEDPSWNNKRFNYQNHGISIPSKNKNWHGGEGVAAWGNGVPADASWNSKRFNYQNHGISTPSKNKNWRVREGAAAFRGREGTAAWGNGVLENASWSSKRFNYENRGKRSSSENKDWHGVEGTAAWGVGESTAAWSNGVLEDASWSSKRFDYENDGRTTQLNIKDRVSDRSHGRKRHGGFWSDTRFTRTKY